MTSLLEPLGEASGLGLAALLLTYWLARAALVYGFFFTAAPRIPGARIVAHQPWSPRQLRDELASNFRVMLLESAVLWVLLRGGFFREVAPSPASLALGFAISFAIFEAWFYFTHRLLHRPSWMKHHREHHRYRVTSPLSALALSPVEKLLNIVGTYLLPGLVFRALGLPFESIVAYSIFNFVINVMGHSNVELIPRWVFRHPLYRISATSTYHSIHHHKGHRHFGLFTSVFDRLGGTLDPDYEHEYAKLR